MGKPNKTDKAKFDDPDWVLAELGKWGTIRDVARAHGWSTGFVSNKANEAKRKKGLLLGAGKSLRPGVRVKGDNLVLVGSVNPQATSTLSPEELMVSCGFDPQEWEYTTTLNRWDALAGEGRVVTLAQLKITAKRKRKLELLVPARTDGWKPDASKFNNPKPWEADYKLVFVTSDLHAPYHDPDQHLATCRMLSEIEPDEAIDLGDMLDLPRPSRHRPTPHWDADPQTCIDEAYQVWADRVYASQSTKWRALLGNHDDRLRIAAEERIPDFADLRKANSSSDSLSPFDVGRLLRFDELGIDLVRPRGEYHAAETVIAEGVSGKPWSRLIGMHGVAAGGKGAPGAGKALDKRMCSVLQGHDHQQGLVYISRWDGDRRVGDMLAGSVGASCRRDGGIGYAVDPNWQQGSAMVTIHSDGRWHVELVRWDGKALVWRDHVWRA